MWPCLAVPQGQQEGDWLRGLGLAPHPISRKGREEIAQNISFGVAGISPVSASLATRARGHWRRTLSPQLRGG